MCRWGDLMRPTFFVPVWGTSSRKLRTLVRTPSWAGTLPATLGSCATRSQHSTPATALDRRRLPSAYFVLRSAQRARMKSNRSDCDVMKRRI